LLEHRRQLSFPVGGGAASSQGHRPAEGLGELDAAVRLFEEAAQLAEEGFALGGVHPFEQEEVAVDLELLAQDKRLFALRNELPALRRGSFETILTDDKQQLYGFRRRLGNEEILVVLNNSSTPQKTSLAAEGDWEDRWNGPTITSQDNRLPLTLAPKSAAILVRSR
jgi:hypothetical protein